MIDKDCFPTFDGKCAAYGGALFPQTVAYTLDDSIDDAIEKLTAYMLSGRSKVESKINLDSHGSSICSGKLSDVSFEYQIEAKVNSVDISFNYSKAIDSLPSSFNVVKSGLELITKNGNIISLDGKIGGASLSPVDFPVNAKFYSNISSPCGLIVLSKALRLPSNDIKSKTDFTIQDFGEDSNSTFKSCQEALVFLNEKIASLDKKIDNRTKIQNGSVSDYIYNINNDLLSAANKSDSIEQELNSSIESQGDNLQDQISSLLSKVEILTSQNKTLTVKVSQLEKQVNS